MSTLTAGRKEGEAGFVRHTATQYAEYCRAAAVSKKGEGGARSLVPFGRRKKKKGERRRVTRSLHREGCRSALSSGVGPEKKKKKNPPPGKRELIA